MPDRELKGLGKVMLGRSTEDMLKAAEKYGVLHDGRIDLRGRSVRFNHSNLDLSAFLFDKTDFGASRLINCDAPDVVFRQCRFSGAWIAAEGTAKHSFARASFEECFIHESTLGPRTLDLSEAIFRGSTLHEVTFRTANLTNSDFTNARLTNVYFRSGLLTNANFNGATLCRVSFERAELTGASFHEVTAIQMDFWGHGDLFASSRDVN